MSRTLSILWGVVLVLIGVAVLAFVAHSVFIEEEPLAGRQRPIAASLFSLGAIWIGVHRIRRGWSAPSAKERRSEP